MPQRSLEDTALRAAMRDWLAAAAALDEAASTGGEARDLMDLAEAKAVAGMTLHKRLVALGWTAPTAQGASAG